MTTSTIEYKTVTKQLPIFSVDISQHKYELETALQGILELRNLDSKCIESNVKANYVSPWMSHHLTNKFDPLCELVLSLCSEISKTYYKTPDIKFKIFNCWGMIYNSGDHSIPHNHFPSTFAAVTYISTENNSAPIIFENELSIYPVSGTLMVFPAIIQHEVPKTIGKRIAVAMNIDYKEG